MADEIWHYGDLGAAIVSVAIWIFKAGNFMGRVTALEKDLAAKHADNVKRLERIEGLLMERRNK